MAAQQIVFDYRKCGFDEVDVALCDYAVKLTLDPGAVGAKEIDLLRQNGLSDEQITIAVQVIAYFNYINRVADGLGVELEDWMTLNFDNWMKTKPDWRAASSDRQG